MKKRFLWAGAAFVLLVTACQNPTGDSINNRASDGPGTGYVLPYSPYDYQVLESKFTNGSITVDGKLDEGIWAQAASSNIQNFKHAVNAEDAQTGATGTIKSVWDGYTLYIAVDVMDNTPANLTLLENGGTGGALGDPTITPKSNGAYALMETMDYTTFQTPPYNVRFDNVEFAVDFWNDKQDKWADDDGLFAVSRSGKLVYDSSGGFGDEGTYASVFASPDAREYNDRIKAYAVTQKSGNAGYTVELALQIYGAKPGNGTAFGVDVMISDAPQDNTVRTSRTYWSHKDNSYRFSSRDGNLDWGAIVLAGHDGQTAFAKSEWMLTNAIRWVDANLPGTEEYSGTGTSVQNNWSVATWTALNNAVKTGRSLLTVDGKHVAASVSQEEIKTKAQAIEGAIAGLIAADDPLGATAMNYPVTNTLPDPLVFKTELVGKKPGDIVASADDWKKRAEEIRQLASIYEYGPKPGAPTSVTVTKVSGAPGFGAHWEPAPWYYPNRPPMQVASSPASYAVETTITYNGAEASVPAGATAQSGSANITFNVYKPAAETGKKVPLILNFDGNQMEFNENSIAVMGIPSLVTSDDRATPWNPVRAGIFRQFYPYGARGQRHEVSNEMGAAWGAWRAIDALEKAKDVPITSKGLSIAISGGATVANTFTLKDRITFDDDTTGGMWWMPDTRAWWQVGKLEGADIVSIQQGAGKAVMLYLAPGSPVPSQETGTYTLTSKAIQHQNEQGVWESVTDRGEVTVTLVVGAEQQLSEKLGDFIDETQIAVTGYSINGKYAFVAALYDERIKVAIPGAAGATGPQTWRYNPAGTVYSGGKGNLAGGELIGDNVMKNPGRATEIFRRFLTHFNYYERLRGIDAKGDFSHGYAQRLPYDGHELVAAMFPRAVIERAVINDFNDGSEQDAIAFQGARIVYRKLVDLGAIVATPGGNNADVNDLLVFNYHAWAPTGDPHGAVSGKQRANESLYMNWYFNGGTAPTYITADGELYPWNRDPFFEDTLVTGGSNSYERHYGGFPVMMPWPWAGQYYPAKQ